MRTLVTFKSTAFNTTQPKDYFVNPCCFGDDTARWLIAGLGKKGMETIGEPDQEDFGWFFNYKANGITHTFLIGYRPGDSDAEGDWIGWVERNRGFIASVFGGRKRGIQPEAIRAIHMVLSESPDIRDVRWHFVSDFDKGLEEAGTRHL